MLWVAFLTLLPLVDPQGPALGPPYDQGLLTLIRNTHGRNLESFRHGTLSFEVKEGYVRDGAGPQAGRLEGVVTAQGFFAFDANNAIFSLTYEPADILREAKQVKANTIAVRFLPRRLLTDGVATVRDSESPDLDLKRTSHTVEIYRDLQADMFKSEVITPFPIGGDRHLRCKFLKDLDDIAAGTS